MQIDGDVASIRRAAGTAGVRLPGPGIFAVAALAVGLTLTGCTGPLLPLSPTPAPVSTAPIVFATASPSAVQRAVMTPIPPPTTPTATARVIPTPIPIPTVQRFLYVAGTGADGLTFRRTPAPDGERIALLPDGTPLTPTGQEEQRDGRRWRQVRDTQGREGWVAAEFLSPTSPLSSAAVSSPEVDIPTMIPTRPISLPPPPPPPTRAPTRTPQSSVPVTPGAPPAPGAGTESVPKPQAPAVVVPTVTRFSPPGAAPSPRP